MENFQQPTRPRTFREYVANKEELIDKEIMNRPTLLEPPKPEPGTRPDQIKKVVNDALVKKKQTGASLAAVLKAQQMQKKYLS